jgi:hypothetical protein
MSELSSWSAPILRGEILRKSEKQPHLTAVIYARVSSKEQEREGFWLSGNFRGSQLPDFPGK